MVGPSAGGLDGAGAAEVRGKDQLGASRISACVWQRATIAMGSFTPKVGTAAVVQVAVLAVGWWNRNPHHGAGCRFDPSVSRLPRPCEL